MCFSFLWNFFRICKLIFRSLSCEHVSMYAKISKLKQHIYAFLASKTAGGSVINVKLVQTVHVDKPCCKEPEPNDKIEFIVYRNVGY